MRRAFAWAGAVSVAAVAASCVVPIDDVSSSGGSSGSGGTSASGGSGGDAQAGQDRATDGVAGGDGALIDAGDGGFVCTNCQCAELGRFATWCGKVNVLKDINFGWVTDSDCSSGCNVNPLDYCTKLWSGTVQVEEVTPVGLKNFSEAGCLNQYPFEGQHELVCYGCVD